MPEKEVEPAGVPKTIETILKALNKDIKLARNGANNWEVTEGSAKIKIAYNPTNYFIAGDALDDILADAENCLLTLRRMMAERRLHEISAHLAAAERAGDVARCNELALEHIAWTKYRHSLRPPGTAQ